MNIKMVDLVGQYRAIQGEIDEAITRVLTSTAFINGPEVDQFATQLSNFIGAKYTIPCANGTDALQVAMMALDLQPGDEVILPVHTYVATAEVIALLRLKPVFVDVDAQTFNIAVDQIVPKITSATRAIVPVHLYGQCADMEPLLAIAAKYNLYVIEDAAQALGAVYHFKDGTVRHAGTMGTIGTTSFFPSKNLGCFGDGGAIFTNDQALAEKIKMVANHGQRIKYHHDLIGVNSRLDTIQAAILLIKMKYLGQYTNARNEAANSYDHALKSVTFIECPYRAKNSSHVFHQYTLKVNDRDRDDFKKYLERAGIPSMIYYPVPLHHQKAYRINAQTELYPVSESLSKSVLSLPIHTEITRAEIDYITEKIISY